MVEGGLGERVETTGDLARAGKCLAVQVGEYFPIELGGEVVEDRHGYWSFDIG